MSTNIHDELVGFPEKDYGSDYRLHALEMYKLYVEMADKISERRQSANSFFLTLNSAIVALVGYVNQSGSSPIQASFFWLVAVSGMVLSFLWYRLVRSYRDINSGKFKIFHEIERQLPLRPYDAEWEFSVGENTQIFIFRLLILKSMFHGCSLRFTSSSY